MAERLPASLRTLADALSELVAQHLRLARLELGRDARALGADLALLAACTVVAGVGYVFCCVALALALATVVPEPAAFATLGLANIAVAAALAPRAAARLRHRSVARSATAELRESLATLQVDRRGSP